MLSGLSPLEREERLVFPSCASHPKQRCEGYCQQCDVPVCFKCLTGPHHGHVVQDMADIVKKIKEEIKKEMGVTESYISRFTLGEAKIDQKISNLIQKFESLEKEEENLRKTWHEEVDNIFNTLQSTIGTMKNGRFKALKSHQSSLQNLGKKLANIMKENKKILKSNQVTDVTSHKSKLKEFKDIPIDVDVMIPALNNNTVKGSELSIDLPEYKVMLRQISISSLTDEVSIFFCEDIIGQC
ncbi:E3 ubiquitin-protein ligase TRIM45-like [Saccostrea cucullata]|uniref:E3 ubiquitin-protein ligase TRIM45-like n=1 Tax=Saccostrea cuccullata TaxID=36930 RepID=UPI002ECFD191